jgi:hypothetical protein
MFGRRPKKGGAGRESIPVPHGRDQADRGSS